MQGALLVGGTSSDAGKSLVVTGLCRSLARQGVRVAPFKAQNMSNNSVVTVDGGEIGRAQGLQAFACGLEPCTRFNPVLLKPGGDRRSHVVLRGRPAGEVGALDYVSRRRTLLDVVCAELAALRSDYDVVVCEGAGSVAEINLRGTDIANMGLAAAANLPAVVVSDIDRGGSLSGLFGATAVLDATDQARIAGYVINKFRGDSAVLAPGLEQLADLTGRPTLGVLPWHPGLWIDAEDSLSTPVGCRVGPADPRRDPTTTRLSVAAIRLPRLSNSTDLEALACDPGVDVTWVDDPVSVAAADLAVLPGTRATVADLDWVRTMGLGAALRHRAAAGRPVLGICGGYQMLGRRIVDRVEAADGAAVDGLGILDLEIGFETVKVLRRNIGHSGDHRIAGYEIHHGRVVDTSDPPWIVDDETGPEGSVRSSVRGTHWHGLLASDGFRCDYLRSVAAAVGKPGFVPAADVRVDDVRREQVDLIADLVEAHLDIDALVAIINDGADPALPTIVSRLR